jgi:hypothetical protein
VMVISCWIELRSWRVSSMPKLPVIYTICWG